MGQFTVTSLSNGQIFGESKVNSIISSAKSAFNRLDSSNFPASCVPLTALQARNSLFYATLAEHGSVAGAVTVGTRAAVTGYFPVPASLSIVSAALMVGSVTGAATNITVQVRRVGTSPSLFASATFSNSTYGTYIAMTVSGTAITSGALMELRYAIPAARTIANVVVVLKCKKNLST